MGQDELRRGSRKTSGDQADDTNQPAGKDQMPLIPLESLDYWSENRSTEKHQAGAQCTNNWESLVTAEGLDVGVVVLEDSI